MQDKYGEENFAVLGFPTDQFGSFAAGTDQEVKDFCQAKYKVSFDLFSKIEVNGEQAHAKVPLRLLLSDFIRDELGLSGTHVGCEHGACGACTIRVNNDIVRGCLMLAVQADGTDVVTIEGLSESGEIKDLQEEFHNRNSLQCGFCTPGTVSYTHLTLPTILLV